MNGDSTIVRLLEDKQPTPESRKFDVALFKSSFNLDGFLNLCERKGIPQYLTNIPDLNERRFHVIRLFEEFYPQPETNFAAFVISQVQNRYGTDLGVCEYLSILLDGGRTKKICSPPDYESEEVNCTSLRKEFCPTYEKVKASLAFP